MATKSELEILFLEKNRRSLSTLARSIILSEGDFSLILVRCNYADLQETMWQKLQQLAPQSLDYLILQDNQNNLYQSIQEFIGNREIYCLHIFGMEMLENLEQILVSSNQMRDEFNQTFNFPIVLWMTDEVLQKMTRLAADFKSWAASAIKFNLESEELVLLWQRAADRLFNQILDNQAEIPLSNQGLSLAQSDRPSVAEQNRLSVGSQYRLSVESEYRHRQELESALIDLEERGFKLSPALAATWQLILGRDAEAKNQFPEAIACYEKSLKFLRQSPKLEDFPDVDLLTPHICLYLERQGVLLLHLGLCYTRQAQLSTTHSPISWQQALASFQSGRLVFKAAGQQKLAAQLLIYQGQVLQSLQSWPELTNLATEALLVQEIVASPLYLAQVYGFLAIVAYSQKDWVQVTTYAQAALGTLERYNLVNTHTSFYLLLLAKSQRVTQQKLTALATLEQAKNQIFSGAEKNIQQSFGKAQEPSWHWLENYLEILEELRSLYGEMHQYLAAFEIKQQQYLVEQQHGIRTFIGASPLPLRISNREANPVATPLLASTREMDVKAIINRLVRADHKLTIIHGASGVGKTSLINSGLFPALHGRIIGTRITLPILQRSYRDWHSNLSAQILEIISQESAQSSQLFSSQTNFQETNSTLIALVDLVKQSIQSNFLVVLIFDQFEDFFTTCTSSEDKWTFYEFLAACLAIPFVKIILSIREDALHHLLDCDRYMNLEVINNNILDREIRYQLGDLSPSQAKELIHNLTAFSRWQLEPSLIEAFVQDLVIDSGAVRLIELQVLGSTLQAEKITTLKAYQNLGPNPRLALIELNLDRIITDCGTENQTTAWQILFHLTDDSSSIRPIKTFSELITLVARQSSTSLTEFRTIDNKLTEVIADRATNDWSDRALWTSTSGLKIELILKILVGSGLVIKVAEISVEGYQLAYDYLSEPIRQRYLTDRQSNITTKLFHQAQELRIIRRQKVRAIGLSLAMGTLALTAVFLAWTAENQRRIAEVLSLNAQLSVLSSSSEALFASGKQFDALLEAVRGGKQLQIQQTHSPINNWGITLPQSVSQSVNQSVNMILPGNAKAILPSNAKAILPSNANAIAETTRLQVLITLQRSLTQIKEKNRLEGHVDIITHLVFSPDGRFIASASRDKTIKIWSIDGKNIATLTGHEDSITSLSFSADGQFLVSGSWDGTAKIWRITPSPQPTNPASVQNEKFPSSPDPLVTWEFVTTIRADAGRIYGVDFSPDGTQIALATQNQHLQIWTVTGKLLKNWQGHQKEVTGVSFSPDGQAIASSGGDGLVKIWSTTGELQRTLGGHQGRVNSVKFSADGTLIATTGDDRTIKLWDRQGNLLQNLTGHQGWVMYADFSADSQFLVSAGRDELLRLWKRDGTLVDSFKAHSDRINAAVFSPKGDLIASASEDKTVKIWSMPSSDQTFRAHQQSIADVKFSPNGQLVTTASHDNTVKLWQVTGNQGQPAKLALNSVPILLEGHSDRLTSLAFAGDGSLLASASRDKTVRIWNLSQDGRGIDKQKVPVVIQESDWILRVAFSPDSQVIATASRNRTVKLWDRQGKLLHTLGGHSDRVNTVLFSPDGLLIASASDDKTVKLWTKDGQLLKTLQGHQGWVLDLAFSSDGEYLASAGYDNRVNIWSRQGELTKTLKGVSDSVARVNFLGNNQIISTTSWNNQIQLWRLDDTLLKTLSGHDDRITSLDWGKDGEALVTASQDGSIILWDLNLENLLQNSCDWLQDYLKNNTQVRQSDRQLCQP